MVEESSKSYLMFWLILDVPNKHLPFRSFICFKPPILTSRKRPLGPLATQPLEDLLNRLVEIRFWLNKKHPEFMTFCDQKGNNYKNLQASSFLFLFSETISTSTDQQTTFHPTPTDLFNVKTGGISGGDGLREALGGPFGSLGCQDHRGGPGGLGKHPQGVGERQMPTPKKTGM